MNYKLFYFLLLILIVFFCCKLDVNGDGNLSILKSTLIQAQSDFQKPMLDFTIQEKGKHLVVIAKDSSASISPELTKYMGNYFYFSLKREHLELMRNKEFTFIREQTKYGKEQYIFEFTPELVKNNEIYFKSNPKRYDNMRYFFNIFKDSDIGLCTGVVQGIQDGWEFYNYKDSAMELIIRVIEGCEKQVMTDDFAPLAELLSVKPEDKKVYKKILKVWEDCKGNSDEIYGSTKKLHAKYQEKL